MIGGAGVLPTDTVPEESLRKAAGVFRVFIAHGRDEPAVKPKESQRARRYFEETGYSVSYREFAGGRQLPAEVLREVQQWMAPAAPAKPR